LKIQEEKGMPAKATAQFQEAGILLSVEEKRIIQAVQSGKDTIDGMLETGDWVISRLQALLMAMEVKGVIKMLPGRKIQLLV
jgi:hypothetical protein